MKYLHLPVQSGSDRVLAGMKRNHTALEYKSRIRKLKAAVPDILISSDFIVGFPGETEKDFEQTMKLIEDVGFDFSYSFVYSSRPGTPAADLVDETPDDVKKQRLSILQQRINQQGFENSRRMAGTQQRILVTDYSKYRAQPDRQFPLRQSAVNRTVCRRAHRRSAAALVARHAAGAGR